ncbi:MAG: hypothetical protein HQL11_04525 [Candidatus Omnitrophica bacterium]|nr:hypothetical protein [Candidatus Omnitrophota bacterium]
MQLFDLNKAKKMHWICAVFLSASAPYVILAGLGILATCFAVNADWGRMNLKNTYRYDPLYKIQLSWLMRSGMAFWMCSR